MKKRKALSPPPAGGIQGGVAYLRDSAQRVLEPHELRALTDGIAKGFCSPRLALLIMLARVTRARISELLALRVRDVTDGRTIFETVSFARKICKGQIRGKTLPLNDRDDKLRRALQQQLAARKHGNDGCLDLDEPLFLTCHPGHLRQQGVQDPSGSSFKFQVSSLSRQNADKELRAFCKRIQVAPFGFHCFRRTGATRMLEDGLSIAHVASALGHTSISSTYTYAKLATRDLTNYNQGLRL